MWRRKTEGTETIISNCPARLPYFDESVPRMSHKDNVIGFFLISFSLRIRINGSQFNLIQSSMPEALVEFK